MWEGAIILVSGIIIGVSATLGVFFYSPWKKKLPYQPKGYDKYKNKDGLYSRKLVKEVGDQS